MLLKQHKLINVRYTRIPDFRFLITFTADPIHPLSFHSLPPRFTAMRFSPSPHTINSDILKFFSQGAFHVSLATSCRHHRKFSALQGGPNDVRY